jgi:hypothetical protein
MPMTWIGYPLLSHNMLLCTMLIKTLVHWETSPMVPNIGRSLKLIKVLSHRGRNPSFHSQLIVSSYKIVQSIKAWMAISGNWMGSLKSTSIRRVSSTFSWRSSMNWTRGSMNSSGTKGLTGLVAWVAALGTDPLPALQMILVWSR